MCAQLHLRGSLWGRLASLAVWSTAGVRRRATGFSHSGEGCILISSFKCLIFFFPPENVEETSGSSSTSLFGFLRPRWVFIWRHHWFYPLSGWAPLSCRTSYTGCSAPVLRIWGTAQWIGKAMDWESIPVLRDWKNHLLLSWPIPPMSLHLFFLTVSRLHHTGVNTPPWSHGLLGEYR